MSLSNWSRDPLQRDVVFLTLSLIILSAITNLFIDQVVLPIVDTPGYLYQSYLYAAELFGSTKILQGGILGIWVGIVISWTLDTYKRLLSVMPMILGLILAYSVGFSWTEFILNISIEPVASTLLFVLITLQLGGLDVISIVRRRGTISRHRGKPIELRGGPIMLFCSVVVLVSAAILDHYLILTPIDQANPLLWNGILGSAIIAILFPFIRYDNNRRIIQVGPGRSGKTSTIGGMYCDIRNDSRAAGEDRSGRKLVGNKLEGISERLTEGQRFPTKTDTASNVSFEYYNSRRLFRRKNTILAFDSPGQLLTGLDGPEDSYTAKLNTYRSKKRSRGLLTRIDEWIKNVLGVNRDPWLSESNSETNVGELLDTADTVIFTLPLDDFLTPTFQRGDSIPEYTEIFYIESVTDGDERYSVTRPWGENFEVYRDEDGQLVRELGDVPEGLSFDSFEELPLAPSPSNGRLDRRYCTDKEREPSQEYLKEYRDLIQLLWEDDEMRNPEEIPEAIWVGTMSDLVYNDFRDPYKKLTRETSEDQEQNSETLQFLREHDLFTDDIEGGEPENFREDYTIFGKWILQKCVQTHIMELRESTEFDDIEYLPNIRSLIEQTGERNLYPVWFDVIRENNFNRIESDNTRLLNGSDRLFNRIEGQRLPNPWYHRFKSTPLNAIIQRINPFASVTGKFIYDAAVDELERVANETNISDESDHNDNSAPKSSLSENEEL